MLLIKLFRLNNILALPCATANRWQPFNYKKKRGSCLLQRGTTKRLQKHKHNPRHTARASLCLLVFLLLKIGRFRCNTNSLNAINKTYRYSRYIANVRINFKVCKPRVPCFISLFDRMHTKASASYTPAQVPHCNPYRFPTIVKRPLQISTRYSYFTNDRRGRSFFRIVPRLMIYRGTEYTKSDFLSDSLPFSIPIRSLPAVSTRYHKLRG